MHLPLIRPMQPSRISIQINTSHHPPLVFTLSHQIPKVLQRNITLLPHPEGLIPPSTELLDRLLQCKLQRVSRELQDLPYGSRDPRAIGVHVIHSLELLGDFGVKAVRKGVRDLVEDVICRCDS